MKKINKDNNFVYVHKPLWKKGHNQHNKTNKV